MAKFSKGQRVRVPMNAPKATSAFYEREGVVTFVAPSAGDIRSALDQWYMVRFDGDDRPQDMGERELEAV